MSCLSTRSPPHREHHFLALVTALTLALACLDATDGAVWPLAHCTPHTYIPQLLQTADFHEALFPTTIQLCLLDSAFHISSVAGGRRPCFGSLGGMKTIIRVQPASASFSEEPVLL